MDPTLLHLRLRLLPAGAIEVTVDGDVDVAAVDDLLATSRLVRTCRPTSVELDLGGVTFVDLHGLRSLDRLRRDQEAHGVKVRERRTPECVAHLRALVATASHVPGARVVDVA